MQERFDAIGMVLSGTAVAGLTFGLSVAGFDIVPWPVVVAMIADRRDRAGALSRLRAAGAGADPRFQAAASCRLSARASIGGFMFRIGVGAMPFLLPLLLQVGFKLTPFQSGMITFTSTMGAIMVKGAAPWMLKRFGFRTVLVANAILGGLSIAACAGFSGTTSFW